MIEFIQCRSIKVNLLWTRISLQVIMYDLNLVDAHYHYNGGCIRYSTILHLTILTSYKLQSIGEGIR